MRPSTSMSLGEQKDVKFGRKVRLSKAAGVQVAA